MSQYEVDRSNPDNLVAVGDSLALRVLDGGKIFFRGGVHMSLGGKVARPETRWLVAELNGVRLYIDEGNKLVLTTQDINP